MWQWVAQLAALERECCPCVLATLTRSGGSTPAPEGAKLLLARDGRQWGTVGGGALEATVLEEARQAMDGAMRLLRLPLSAQGQCCGGLVEVLLEPLFTTTTLHVLGAGHVARELAQVLEGSRLAVVLVDARPEWIGRGGLPERVRCVEQDPVAYVEGVDWRPGRDMALVMTHSHELDRRLMDLLLRRHLAWLGLIGSQAKWRSFRGALAECGHDAFHLDAVHCPVGDPRAGKAPREVAISLAQCLLVSERGLRREETETIPAQENRP